MTNEQHLYAYAIPESLTNEKVLMLVQQRDENGVSIPVSRNPNIARNYGGQISGAYGYGSVINLRPLLDSGALSLEKLFDLDAEIAKSNKSPITKSKI